MAELALLNDKYETPVCREMLDSVARRLAGLERVLATSVLDRETYLEKIHGANALRSTQEELQAIYRKRFPS